jgi:hypothetical protein
MSNNNNQDLRHRDWLLRSQIKLTQQTTPAVKTQVFKTQNDGRLLQLSNVTEDDLIILSFLTNTDKNNNYLYLENIELYLNDEIKPFKIPGLKEMLIQVFENSDISAFLNNNKTHTPFNTDSFNGERLGDYIDNITSQIPFLQNTLNIHKKFVLYLNPDYFNVISSIVLTNNE